MVVRIEGQLVIASIEIRDAQAADASFLAWVMLAAARSPRGRGLWDDLLAGSQSERAEVLERYCCTPLEHSAHYTRFRIAVVDGRPAAALAAYPADDAKPEDDGEALIDVLAAMGWSVPRIRGVIERAKLWASVYPPLTPGAWAIESVATIPELRRCGLAKRLLSDALREGAARGHTWSELSVAIGNRPAIAAYRSHGFRVASVHTNPELLAHAGVPGVVRMVHARDRVALCGSVAHAH